MTNSVHFHIRKPTLSPHFESLSVHPPHQLAYRRQMSLAPCGTSQVLWQVITLIFKEFKHVIFELLLNLERMLGHYTYDLVSPW
jgi:hypothetical protein